jgi:sugar transferase (PEP-CTERM system associated)
LAVSRSRSFIFTLFQDLILIAGILAASTLRYAIEPFDLFTQQKAIAILVVFLFYKVTFYYFNLYQTTLHLSLREFVSQLLLANIVALVLLTGLYYFTTPLVIGRGILSLCVFFIMLFTTLHRLIWSSFSHDIAFTKNLIILGVDKSASIVLSEIMKYRHSGYRILGLVDINSLRVGEEVNGTKIIGTSEDLLRIHSENHVDEIVVALEEARGNLPLEILMELKIRGVQVIDSTQFHEQFTGKIVLEGLRASWFIYSEGFAISRLNLIAKRIFDLTTAIMLIILTLPLTIFVGLLIKLSSSGPLLYRQERVGLRGQSFMLIKFRSMLVDAEKHGPVWAQANDPRVTRIGRIIRQFRIDELPQAWNVIKGEMSFVGPRPERPFFIQQLSKQLAFYTQRHLVKPGITGWAQVRYPYGSSEQDSKEKLQLDLYYIKNISIAFDVKILLETISVILGKMKVH